MWPLSPAKNRYMFWSSPMSVWSITPVLESLIVPVKSVCTDDQPLALVGSDDVRYENAVGPHWYASTQMFLGAKKISVGATVPEFMPFWLAEAMSDQFVKVPKFIEPYDPDVFTSDA